MVNPALDRTCLASTEQIRELFMLTEDVLTTRGACSMPNQVYGYQDDLPLADKPVTCEMRVGRREVRRIAPAAAAVLGPLSCLNVNYWEPYFEFDDEEGLHAYKSPSCEFDVIMRPNSGLRRVYYTIDSGTEGYLGECCMYHPRR